jgi:phage-related protein (TIGR01555 family)
MSGSISKFFSAFRADGWSNILTGLGRAERDKVTAAVPVPTKFSQAQFDDLYLADDMAKKVVARPARDMFRAGYNIKPTTEGDAIEKYLRQLNANNHLRRAVLLSRLYGGSVVIMGIDDGQTADMPVKENAIKSIKFLTALDRHQIYFDTIQNNPALPGFGLPETYRLSTGNVENQGAVIHKSRLLRFDGVELPERAFVQNNYWGESYLADFFRPLQNFNTAMDSAANLTSDYSQAVYELENLHDLIASGNDELVQKRLALLDATRSVVRAVVIQKGEVFRRETTALTGYSEVLTAIANRMVAATDLPHTVMLGEGSTGNTSGRSEQADYYDYISQQQTTLVQPQLERLVSYICAAADGPKVAFESVSIEWNALKQQTESEKAATNKTQAEADSLYIQNGVLDPAEVADARFGKDDSEIPLQRETVTPDFEPPAETQKLDGAEYVIQSLILFKAEFSDAAKAGAWIAARDYSNANIEETENSFRFEQRPEAETISGSAVRVKMQAGVEAILALPRSK